MSDILSIALFVALVSALSFVFKGDPDLWDLWHQQAMQSAQGKVCK